MSDKSHEAPEVRAARAAFVSGIGAIWLLTSVVVSCKSTDDVRQVPLARVDNGWPKANRSWTATNLPELKVPVPTIAGAEYVNNDALCAVCHEAYVQRFKNNVHRREKCESCHGAASRHLDTRGQDPGSILSFSNLSPPQRSEICAKCHEEDACAPAAEWRRSAHAHNEVSCTDCHVNSHYNLAANTPTVTPAQIALDTFPKDWRIQLASAETPEDEDKDEEKESLPSLRGASNHLGAVAPYICYRCHQDTYALEEIAHPHQIHGPNSLNCTSCHNSHGNVLPSSRRELCLQCHDGNSATAAWHSSTHDLAGVACTDCHNPHPNSSVQRVVNINHTTVGRSPRLPMSVDDPNVCYQCHQKIRGLTSLPSHHPIQEGKISCGDCHDPHGRHAGNLTEPTLNLVCYKCHADKQGPFVYEHPPVTEDCSYCHEPHGAVNNNLLHQPPAFLCLRCHTGHRVNPVTGNHFGLPVADIDNNPLLRPAYYSDCTQCHDQVHGSDLPSQRRAGALLR